MKRLFYILVVIALVMTPYAVRAEEAAPASSEDVKDASGGQAAEAAVPAVSEDVKDTSGGGEQAAEAEPAEEELVAELPPPQYKLEPEIKGWLGYDFVDFDGSKRAGEFVWPHSSVIGGYRLHYSPLPIRLDTELEWINQNSFLAEFAGAYKDILKLNYIGWSLWHNLDHLVPEGAVVSDDHNPGDDYHVTVRDNKVFLRLKWPERPFHVFMDYRHFEKEGTVQARWYESVAPGTKGTKARDIDWITDRYIAGINGNLGLFEVEYSHLIKDFTPHKDVTLRDSFVFPFITDVHSVVPKTTTNADTIKVHTDLTGGIVAAATFINGERDNENSHSEVNYRRAYGDLTLIPFNHVTVAIKYRYKELMEEVPQVFGMSVFGSPGITTQPMESHSNLADVAVRYSPFTNLGIKAEYTLENIKRFRRDGWNEGVVEGIIPFQEIPSVQNINTVKLAINTRPVRSLDFKGSVEYKYTNDTEFPIQAGSEYRGRFHAEWTPLPTVSAGVHYRFTAGENSTANMSSRYDNAGGQAVWTPVKDLFFTAAYDYFRNMNVRDLQLTLGGSPDTSFPTERVPYRDTSHVYALSAGYAFTFPLSIEAGFHQSWSKGMFRTRAVLGGSTTSGIGELADLRVRETGGTFTAKYDFPKGWGTSLKYLVNNYEDFIDNSQNGPQDGTAHSVMLIVSKKW